MNSLVYIHWNLTQLDKVEKIEYNGPQVIAWTEGQETSDGWVDAWQEANRDANSLAFSAQAESRRGRAVTRAGRMANLAGQRLAPTSELEQESEGEDQDLGEHTELAGSARGAAPTTTTRYGRAIRRPGGLLTYYG
ncbi:hypothetical protein CYMTET_22705 [Cymbomonas tetramitiformis]|uniref:Uncharacterized protein n=1 Tax=Cymbomonas tetramitiformis TaxID=36881 RepID=A0AAE0FZX2_9CHLO|nr:hypothetical protein CYMTET_22705 [Cymbomonas tetramitiformis]